MLLSEIFFRDGMHLFCCFMEDPRLKNEYGLTCFQGLAPGKERQRMQNRPSVTMPDSSRLQQPSSRYCASDISSVSSASSMESPRMIGTHEKNGLSSFRVSSGPYLNQSFLSSSTNDDLCVRLDLSVLDIFFLHAQRHFFSLFFPAPTRWKWSLRILT